MRVSVFTKVSRYCVHLCYFAGVVIGFHSVFVNVTEDGGNAVLTVVLNGTLRRQVKMSFTTTSDTALGKTHIHPEIISTDICLQLPVITLQHQWT